ncbi:MAG: hypothetical protein ACRDK3_03295 [Actinomycetota bacterium]
MTQLHAIGSVVLLVAAAAYFLFALYSARTGVHGPALMKLRLGVVGLAAAQLAVGAVLYATGRKPAETLHILYGIVAVAALPIAATFAQEAPPKARAGALAAGAGLMLVMIWRLWVTGGG